MNLSLDCKNVGVVPAFLIMCGYLAFCSAFVYVREFGFVIRNKNNDHNDHKIERIVKKTN